MPLPQEYQRATEQFYNFLSDVKEIANFASSHQAYTMVQGVFQVFRRRLSINESIMFANTLPAILRAIFVSDWDTAEPMLPFEDFNKMNLEVMQLRGNHNFSTNNAITDVATALRLHVDSARFEKVLSNLPGEARIFWQTHE